MLKVGYHISIAGSIDLAFDRANELQCTAMQIFATNPRTWRFKPLVGNEQSNFVQKSKKYDIPTVVHMPYLPNISSSDETIFSKSVTSLKENIDRCNNLGIKYLVVHLGSHMGHGKEKGLQNVLEALDQVKGNLESTTLLLENEAGQNNTVGSDIKDLEFIYNNAPKKSIGFCLDTCHLFAAGYDVAKTMTLDQIESELGWDKVHALHFNDAKFPFKSHLDRHANIGYGYIGEDGFRTMLHYKGIAGKVLILETPQNPDLKEGEEVQIINRLAR